MALAGIAGAAGTGEFVVPTAQDVNDISDFGAGDYAFSFSIDESDLVYTDGIVTSLSGGKVLALYGLYSGTEYYTNGFIVNVDDGAITLSVGRGTLSGLPSGDSALLPSTDFSISSDGVSGGAFMTDASVPLTLNIGQEYVIKNVHSIDGRNVMQSVSIYEAGNNAALATVNYKGNMAGGGDDATSQTIAVWGNAAYNVAPEPTTATLSLLALVGLAARRRRR